MINQTKALKLIKIYDYVCKKYEQELKYSCERFSNNNQPVFTDQEVITIYLFSIYEEQKFKL
ncbi:MAG: transposase, partial [Lutibacter sp.]